MTKDPINILLVDDHRHPKSSIAEIGLGSTRNFSIRRNVLNGILKRGDREFGILCSGFLVAHRPRGRP